MEHLHDHDVDHCSTMQQHGQILHTVSRGRLSRRNAQLTSRFRGVCYNKKCKRWQASTNAYGKYLYLGLFTTESAAAQAYDVAALKIRGDSSQTNFPMQQYLDGNGALPVDEHLDDTLSELRKEAARQLLEELGDTELALEINGCDDPADKIAVIKQLVGSRRLAGLQEELMLLFSKESVPAVSRGTGSGAAASINTASAASKGCTSGPLRGQQQSVPGLWPSHQQENCLQPPLSLLMTTRGGDGLAQLGLPNEGEFDLLRTETDVWQLGQLQTVPSTAVLRAGAAAAVGADSGTSIPAKHQSDEGFTQDRLLTGDPATAVGGQHVPSPGAESSMLVENTVLNSHWPKVSTASCMVVAAACQAAAPQPMVQPAAVDSWLGLITSKQQLPSLLGQDPPAKDSLQASSAGNSFASPTAAERAAAVAAPGAAAAATQPTAARALPHPTPISDEPGMISSGVAGMVAAGTPLAINGSLSCVSLAWLQSHLPPHCQLQHVLHCSGGVVGVLYSQPCSAVAAGLLWGSAAWDGSCFQFSQLYGTAAEAVSLCCSVMQLIVSCRQQSHQLQPK